MKKAVRRNKASVNIDAASQPAMKMNKRGLPEHFRQYFWDCDFDTVSWRKHKVYVVVRILTHGAWADIVWMREKVGDAWLKKWFVEKQGRELSWEQLNLWGSILGVPKEAIDTWLKNDHARKIWENRLMS